MKKINLSNKKSSYMETERIYSKLKPYLMKASIFILIFTVIISVIIILQYNPTRSEINSPDTASPPGWYQQYLPNVNNKPLSDLYFLDSLTGFFCTAGLPYNDTNYIVKTTNGGDNWFIVFRDGLLFRDIFFVNRTTGFIGGTKIYKTTNAGLNWNMINMPFGILSEATYVINEDTIWFSDTDPLTGGIFRTTNEGASWQKMDNGITGNYPKKLYFYNSNIGFASFSPQSNLFKTTNGGVNWFFNIAQ